MGFEGRGVVQEAGRWGSVGEKKPAQKDRGEMRSCTDGYTRCRCLDLRRLSSPTNAFPDSL